MKLIQMEPAKGVANSIMMGYLNHATAVRKALNEGYKNGQEPSVSPEEIKAALGDNLGEVETLTDRILQDAPG